MTDHHDPFPYEDDAPFEETHPAGDPGYPDLPAFDSELDPFLSDKPEISDLSAEGAWHGADGPGAEAYGAGELGAEPHITGEPNAADLHGADLHGADLHGADLHGADLHGADLHGADLHGADLHGAGAPTPDALSPDAQVPDDPGLDGAADLAADGDEPVDVFPPAVDVGALPEPVDGFPWIDSGSLGLADIAAAVEQAGLDPVQPEELAEYAAADLPPGVDPWAELAGSDDPATSTLARWWSQN